MKLKCGCYGTCLRELAPLSNNATEEELKEYFSKRRGGNIKITHYPAANPHPETSSKDAGFPIPENHLRHARS